MTITGLDHITINVVSLEVSKAFYENVFMLTQNGFIDMGDHTLTYYALPCGVRLELIDYEMKDMPVSVAPTHVGMYRHFCLEVDSLNELMERCRQYKAAVTSEPAFVEGLGRRNMLLLDPNGVEIEVFEEVKGAFVSGFWRYTMNQEKKIVLNHEEKKALNLEELKQINGGATMSIGKICKRCHRFVTTDPTIPDESKCHCRISN